MRERRFVGVSVRNMAPRRYLPVLIPSDPREPFALRRIARWECPGCHRTWSYPKAGVRACGWCG